MRISDWSSDVCSSDLFYQRKRLGQVIIATVLQAPYAFVQRGQPAEHDDGCLDAQSAQRSQDGQAIYLIGKHAVQDDDVPRLGRGELQAFGSVITDNRPVAPFPAACATVILILPIIFLYYAITNNPY